MSDLVGNPEDRFSRVEAQMVSYANYLICIFMIIDKIIKNDDKSIQNQNVN